MHRRLEHYAYEILPRVYAPPLALLFYRWEIILRDAPILGILGITLRFYVDSAVHALRVDLTFILLLITTVLTLGVNPLVHYLPLRLE